ncbi:hypothetical protein V8C43DRAFT_269416 [Trichoderma afarasin]
MYTLRGYCMLKLHSRWPVPGLLLFSFLFLLLSHVILIQATGGACAGCDLSGFRRGFAFMVRSIDTGQKCKNHVMGSLLVTLRSVGRMARLEFGALMGSSPVVVGLYRIAWA